MKKWKLFLDLDGVVVNLQLPLMELWGAKIDSEDEYPAGFHWDIQGAINFVRQCRGLDVLPHTAAQFWNTMSREWWSRLLPYPEAIDFVRWLESGPFDICLATATVNSESAAAKVDWIHQWLPEYDQKSFIGYPKHLLAGPDSILIDDRDKNCDEFIRAGGRAILVPRAWNKGYYNPECFNTRTGNRRPIYNAVIIRLYEMLSILRG